MQGHKIAGAVTRAGLSAGARRFSVRTALALGALLIARFVPFLGLVMALIGSFLTIAVRCASHRCGDMCL